MASSFPAHMNGLTIDTAGAKIHTFDPSATPAQKAAVAGNARDQLKPVAEVLKPAKGFVAKEVPLDSGSNVAPTITVDDADELREHEKDEDPRPSAIPGTLSEQVSPAVPEWYKVGWRAVSGIDKSALEGEELDKSLVSAFLSEAFYGQWYHNAALVFVAVAASHFMTLFRMGWGWTFVLLAFCATYYSTSIARVRARVRSEIQRELVKTRLVSPDEHETAEWINNFLDRFWLIYEPVLSATIVSSVDQILSASTPAFLDSIRLSTFTLGTRAPRIDKVHTYPRTEDDIVLMDWGLSFTPNDISNLTPRQAASRVNPKIILSIRLGKGLATAAMPILLEDLSFSGLMRIKLKLMTNFPHVQVVEISFLEKPMFDYVLKPIGGETFGFDIGHMPGLSAFIRDMVHSTLGPMLYDPNVFTLNLEQMLSGAPIDAAIGVLQVYIRSARGLKGTKIGGGNPDPYVTVSFNNRDEKARTKHRPDTVNPTWNEVKFILVHNITETLTFNVFDYNEHRKDTELGAGSFELAQLNEDATREGVVAKVLRDGKERGELTFDVSYFPVLKPKKVDGKDEPLPETKSGIVRLIVHQAKELDVSKSLSGDLNPFAKVYLGAAKSEPIHATTRVKHTNNPVWESPTEFICADRSTSVITIDVIDDRDFLKDPVVGHLSVKLADLLESKVDGQGRDWWPLSQCKSGKLRLSAEWKPLNMAGSMQGADQYVPPIGIVRLWIQKAVDVKNVEAALGGKSDPYVRVLVNNVTLSRTEVVNNNLSPEWDQIVYVPVHSLKEVMVLECMDYQHLTKDRSLGVTELRVSDLAKTSGDQKYPYASTGRQQHQDPLRQAGASTKGTLHFAAEFVPAMRLKGIKFDAGGTELENAVAKADKEHKNSVNVSTVVAPTASRPLPEDDDELEFSYPTPESLNVSTPTDAKSTVSDEGIELTREELLSHQSGVVIFDVESGTLPKKAKLEILLDDGYWPVFGTTKARSLSAKWDQVGEGFIKELEFGKIWLRLNENEDGDKEDIIAQFKFDAKPFLEQSLGSVVPFALKDMEGREVATINIASRFVPIDFKLEPRESVNNQGILRVELIDGKEMHGADRSGKSDPYVVFTLNDDEVYKSQTIKKTLAPVWHESFSVSVPSRVAANFSLEVFDWNQIERAKSLGTARINVADLEPFTGVQRTFPLTHVNHGDKGEIRLHLTFQPEIIAKTRKATSALGSAGRAMTTVGAMPLGAGKGLVMGVGNAGKSLAKGVFRKDHAAKSSVEGYDASTEPPATQISVPSGGPQAFPVTVPLATVPPSNGGVYQQETGTLKVTVLGAKDLGQGGDDLKPYVVIKLADKECKTKHCKGAAAEWDETFSFSAGPETKSMNVSVFDRHTIAKDKLLGEADVDIWKHVQPGGGAVDVSLELRDGHGLLQIRLEFEKMMSGRASTVSIDRGSISPSRFTLRRKHASPEH